MLKTVLRPAFLAGSVLGVGPVCWWLTATLRGPDGGQGVAALLSTSPALGLLRGAGAMALAGGVGVLTARLVSYRSGLFAAGLALAWSAYGSGGADTLLRSLGATGVVGGAWKLGAEGLMLGLLGAVVAFLAGRVRAGLDDGHQGHEEPVPKIVGPLAALLALPAGLVASWAVAQNTLPGQALAAGLMAGLLTALGGMIVHHRVNPAWSVLGLAFVAGLAPLSGLFMHKGVGQAVLLHANEGMLFPTLRLLPWHWVAGALLGVPFGLSLGAWLLAHKLHTEQMAADGTRSTGGSR
jgi:hypothetical protein